MWGNLAPRLPIHIKCFGSLSYDRMDCNIKVIHSEIDTIGQFSLTHGNPLLFVAAYGRCVGMTERRLPPKRVDG